MARSWRWRTGEGPPISAADPTEAATLRRDLDADQARRRRIELPTLTGIVVLGFVTAFRGTTVPWLYALGGWFVALSAVLLFARRQRTALERGTNARGRAPMLVRDSGESATIMTTRVALAA